MDHEEAALFEMAATEALGDDKVFNCLRIALLGRARGDWSAEDVDKFWMGAVDAQVERLREMRRNEASERDGDAIRSAERDERAAS